MGHSPSPRPATRSQALAIVFLPTPGSPMINGLRNPPVRHLCGLDPELMGHPRPSDERDATRLEG